MVTNCFRCNDEFEAKRASTILCKDCRKDLHNVRQMLADRERSIEIKMLLNNVLPDIPVEMHPQARNLAKQIIKGSIGIDAATEDDVLASGGNYVPDKQPSGTKSARGADEGYSTYSERFATELYGAEGKDGGKPGGLAGQAVRDPWWDEHQSAKVFFLLDEPEVYEIFMKKSAS